MATIPFVQLEGFLALPRMRPLDRIPPPFGQDWKLQQPRFGLHAEIHALYAAITRATYLGTEAFFPPHHGNPPCDDFPAPVAAPVGAAASAAAQPARPTALPRKLVRRARRRRRMPRFATRKFAGGVCAIGGAALLTWIIASHAPHGDDVTTTLAATRPNGGVSDSASQRRFAERPAHERMIAATPPPRPAKVTAEPSSVASSRHANPADAASTQAAARTSAPQRLAAPLATHRSEGTYAHASPYSPRPQATPLDDDYASVVTYASTYTAPRPVSGPPIPVDSTEWVKHVLQRRVTEIPERFVE